MAFTITSRPAPVWLRDLANARATYQELFGWPISVQVGRRNLVVTTGRVLEAVSMPAVLGARVHAQLVISLLSAPVLANASGTLWTFLAKPDGPIHVTASEALSTSRVRVFPPGSPLVVPVTFDSSTAPAERWIETPRPNRALPPLHAVVGFTRRLLYHGRP